MFKQQGDRYSVARIQQAEEHFKRAVENGVPAAAALLVAAGALRSNWCLDQGRCPECGERMTRRLDPRQAGCREVPGEWFNYRHDAASPGGQIGGPSTILPTETSRLCRYLVDRKEKEAAPEGAAEKPKNG